MTLLNRLMKKIKTQSIFIFHERNISWKSEPAYIPHFSSIETDKKSNITFGKHFGMRDGSFIECKNGGNLEIGDNVFFNRNCVITCLHQISIGDRCIFGPHVLIYDHDHVMKNERVVLGEYRLGSITIENDCWIGGGAIILKNTSIGEGSIIGAGAIVIGNIPKNSIVTSDRELHIRQLHS